jgi:Leucine-rich repeat (LRR) protein
MDRVAVELQLLCLDSLSSEILSVAGNIIPIAQDDITCSRHLRPSDRQLMTQLGAFEGSRYCDFVFYGRHIDIGCRLCIFIARQRRSAFLADYALSPLGYYWDPKSYQSIPGQECVSIGGFDIPKKVESLYLGNNILSTFIDSLVSLKNLKYLYLSRNNLTALPESLGSLVNLKILDLWFNKVITLPESIGSLKNLEHLNLRNNNLSALPESIGSLVNLKVLSLKKNNLTELPDSLGSLVNLESLYLGNNSLAALPESFGSLVNLEHLYLERNNLTALPESIKSLVNLKELDLYDNPVARALGLSDRRVLPERCVVYI